MRILVVEDETELLSVIAQALREEGYAVDEASEGETGLYKAESWNYDAIVLDWMLPKLAGVDLLKQLRKSKRTPVLMLTAKDTVKDRVSGLDSGADDYLVKPFALTELFARLRALIRRSAGQASTEIEIGEFIVNTRNKTVSRGVEQIPLTAREYALLEILVLNRGQVITRTQLYESIFDENEDTLSNLLDVHVSNIRKKLGKDLIQTRRGQGYLIDV